MNRTTRITAVAATLLVLAACSSSPEAAPDPTTSSTTTTSAPAPSPTETETTPEESPNMPDVVGMTAADAREQLVADGLRVQFFDAATGDEITEAAFDSSTITVAAQQPIAGDPKVDSGLAWLTVDIGTPAEAAPTFDLTTDEGLCAADAELTNLELNDALAPILGYPADRDARTFEQDEAIRAHKNAAFLRACPARAS